MQLKSLKVANFKKIETAEILLSDVNILVGSNGSGKSSIIQAVHLACCVIRQAERVDSSQTSTVSVDELDYLPSDNYKTLGHKANWGNKDGSPSSEVSLTFARDDETFSSNCTLRSARNAGISIKGTVPAELSSILRMKRRFFSAYIPGISGIPNKEDKKSKKYVLKACSFGDSNVILRNALLLLHESDANNIRKIENWIRKIIGPVEIKVFHDNDNDLYITCTVTIAGEIIPIELIGTGYLQLIQIFSYILLFGPGVLLIDEPDIHLHPDIQERLVGVLSEVAKEKSIKILLTTHSPFIVRGAPVGTNVCWLNEGKIESNNRELVELALGWGAFGKKIIVVSEDTNNALLKKLVSQWPGIDRVIAFLPGNGYKNLLKPKQAKELSESLGGKFKILVHRDRDSLTDDEVNLLVERYNLEGVHAWFPAQSDVEAYFCSTKFLEAVLSCTHEEAEGYLTKVLDDHKTPIRDQFNSQRAAHNSELHQEGGSPTNETVWKIFQERPLRGAKGKFVYKQLRNIVPHAGYSEEKVMGFELGGLMALDLKHKIEKILVE